MDKDKYNLKVQELIEKSKQKGLIKTYSEFLETDESKIYAVAEEDAKYYIFKYGGKLEKYKIGDIVFVSKYKYKNWDNGTNHSFVIIDDSKAVDINYFGFLISSQVQKTKYSFNELLKKNGLNNLRKDSIVKCDDLITIVEEDISFKIGEVTDEELEKFINTYSEYIENK